LRHFLLVTVAVFALSASAYGIPIIFTFSGTATGTANGVPFTSASFAITYASDTSLLPPLGSGFNFYPDTTTSISITGVGHGTFSNKFQVFTQIGTSLVFLYDRLGSASFGIIYPNLAQVPFDSAFGPISVTLAPGSVLHESPSSLGAISFSSLSNLTFGAVTPTIPVPATPVPSSLILAMTGLAAAAFWYQLRSRGSQYRWCRVMLAKGRALTSYSRRSIAIEVGLQQHSRNSWVAPSGSSATRKLARNGVG
jgi:hypothetical protein